MKKMCSVGVILLAGFFTTVSNAAGQVPAPVKFTIKSDKTKFTPCRLIKVTADGGGKTVLWRFDGDLSDTEIDGKTFRFVASNKTNVVTIKAYTASIDGDVIEAILVLEADTPPLPPQPIDPLVEEIRKMVTMEEKVYLKKLAALYELMAKESLNTANKSAAAINDLYKQSAANLVQDKLKNVREKLGNEIMNACPDDPDSDLTQSQRTALSAVFLHLQKICLEV